MKNVETRGLVLFNRHYRERDMLVKIFTESFGKRMFFVKNAGKSRLTSSLQNFTCADFFCTLNEEGFSFINDASEAKQYATISADLTKNAHASVIISLADEALADGEADPQLYGFLTQTLDLINENIDSEILMDIFELQILTRFGVSLNLSECSICGRRDLPLDFSETLDACLCQNHFSEDPKRLHLDPNVLVLVGQFLEISLANLRAISVKPDMKKKLSAFIHQLYDRYVGVETKAQKFLSDMDAWL